MIYERAVTASQAAQALRMTPNARVLAGGQSLIAAMKLGMIDVTHLIDLQDVEALKKIELSDDILTIGAMATHDQIAHSLAVQSFCPALSALAGGIADQQVRNRGTIGGSMANNDPAACWPAGVLALGATIVTTQRDISADAFFIGVYTTALEPDEVIVAVRFARPQAAHYIKFEQPASRFALVGVAIARFSDHSRVAITGLGHGATRWLAAEQALARNFSQAALDTVPLDATDATSDLHATAAYRAHLARVLTRRAVAATLGETATLTQYFEIAEAATVTPMLASERQSPQPQLAGEALLPAPISEVWHALLDPVVLRTCIAGCESMEALDANRYIATIKLGIGPFIVRLAATLTLRDMRAPEFCRIELDGDAAALGRGSGVAAITLTAVKAGTRIQWTAATQMTGKLAQLGSRLTEATAKKLARDFFEKFALSFATPRSPALSWWKRLWKGLFRR
ncbi:MAG: hypothetical protein EAZ30_13975 [Betaproteobacteria bacterium]|nr:MAG: hypothetical protein EAZ30_13975 [Betaproteobacteria bacterium]